MNGAEHDSRTPARGPPTWVLRLAHGLSDLHRRFRYAILSQSLILLVIIVLIHWSLLTSPSGCVNWGNFEIPCVKDQYVAWSRLLLTWQPFTFMGAALPIPFGIIVGQLTTWVPLTAFSLVLGPAGGAKLFVVLSALFLGIAFLQFSKAFVRSYWGRMAGAVLLIAGPFQLGLYGEGDYFQFVAQAFLFLSLYLLWLAVSRRDLRWVTFPLSLIALVLSISQVQIFELGMFLYAFSFVIFGLSGRGSLRSRLPSFLRLVPRLLFLPVLLAPLFLPALFSASVSLSPSSSYAPPLDTFRTASASPLSVFLGDGYLWTSGPNLTNNIGYAMVSSTSGGASAALWFSLTIALVFGIWAGIVLLGERRGYCLLGFVVLCSFLGAGVQGPLGGFNTTLYLHLYGYQELYASYMWDWVVIVPLTAIAFGIVAERIASKATRYLATSAGTADKVEPDRSPARAKWPRSLGPIGARHRERAILGIGVAIAVLVVISAAFPITVGAQYGPVKGQGALLVGLQTVPYPASFSEIPGLMERLVGANYSGVAVFNPAPAWLLANSTWASPNYFLYYPTVRTPTLPGWGLPPYASNFYTYWAYSELYANASRYVGELLAIEGIQYLLVFYGTEPGTYLPFSEGANVSQLLRYQSGIAPVFSSKDFAVYQDLYYTNTVESLSNISLVAGGYSTLDAMAYGGISLSDQGIIFPEDILESQCAQDLEHVSRVYATSTNSLEALALACTASDSSNPVNYVFPGQTIDEGWSSSYSNSGALGQNISDAWPAPLAATIGYGHSVSIPVDTGGCPSPCSLWLPVRLGAQPGGSSLAFEWGRNEWTLNTTREWGGYNNSMVWVQLPFNVTGASGTLQVTSAGSYNAIGEVYAASAAQMNAWLRTIETTKPVLFLTAGSDVAPPSPSGAGQTSGYCELTSADALGGSCLSLRNSGASPLTLNLSLPVHFSGWLSLLVRSLQSTTLEIGPEQPQLFGFDAGNVNASSPVSMAWIRVPVSSTELSSNGTLSLALLSGALYLSEVVAAPSTTFPPPSAAFPAFNLSVLSENLSSAVAGLRISSEVGPGETTISGWVNFSSGTPDQNVGAVWLNQSPSGPSDLALGYELGPGLLLNFDGLRVAGASPNGFAQFGEALRSSPNSPTPYRVNLSFIAWGNRTSLRTNASFAVTVRPIELQTVSNVTDISAGSSWTVASDTEGYRLSGGPSQIILARVPFYSNLAVTPGSASLSPALGSVDSLLWNPANATVLRVTPSSGTYLEIGSVILVVAAASWVILEFVWLHRNRIRFKSLRTRVRALRGRRKKEPNTGQG